MKNSTISSNGKKLMSFLDEKMYDGSFTNNDLVQFIEQCGKYLNLKTIPNYANENKMSYNGVKSYKITHVFILKNTLITHA